MERQAFHRDLASSLIIYYIRLIDGHLSRTSNLILQAELPCPIFSSHSSRSLAMSSFAFRHAMFVPFPQAPPKYKGAQ